MRTAFAFVNERSNETLASANLNLRDALIVVRVPIQRKKMVR